MPQHESQSAASVLMVRPAAFGFNPETAASNAFQRPADALHAGHDLAATALREFDAVAASLQAAGIEVIVAQDSAPPVRPDAVFPNNWLSFHADGTLVLYPMLAQNRRWERREDVIVQVQREGGFGITRTVDLSHHEAAHKFLEGTGSLVLDRTGRVAYAALSPRTDLDVLGDFSQQLDYELVTFDAADQHGRAVYHTNVLMAIGTGFAVLCAAAITGSARRAAVQSKLHAGSRQLIDISLDQMGQFAGNLLELRSSAGPVIALSARAWRSLDEAQRRVLERHGRILAMDIPAIEHAGGGSVRCMLAEIHAPKIARLVS